MSTDSTYPHISISEDGTPRIGVTRYKVIHLAAEHYQHGWTAEELLRQHPDLRPEQVYSALAYFYENYQELVNQMNATFSEANSVKRSQPFSRAELLARLGQRKK